MSAVMMNPELSPLTSPLRSPSSAVSAFATATAPPAIPPLPPPVVIQAKTSPAAGSVPTAMLANPLVLQATVLRKPDFFEQVRTPELAEEGDLLFDALRHPVFDIDSPPAPPPQAAASGGASGTEPHRRSSTLATTTTTTTTGTSSSMTPAVQETLRRMAHSGRPVGGGSGGSFGVQPTLTLPDRIGTYVTQESFRAFLCFFNSASYPLSALQMNVDATKPDQQRMILIRREVPQLEPKSTYSCVAEIPLCDPGPHTLRVTVTYNDPSGEHRRLAWASTVNAERPISETGERVFRRVRLLPLSGEAEPGVYPPPASAGAMATSTPAPPSSSPSSASLTLFDALADLRLPTYKYLLTVGLKNTASTPIVLNKVRLVLEGCSSSGGTDEGGTSSFPSSTGGGGGSALGPLIPLETCWEPRTAFSPQSVAQRRKPEEEEEEGTAKDSSPGSAGGQARPSTSGSCAPLSATDPSCRDLVSLHLTSGEVRAFTFSFSISPAALRPHAVLHTSTGSTGGVTIPSAGGGARGSGTLTPGPAHLLSSRLQHLGHLQWQWTRANGERGEARSLPLRAPRLPAQPDVDVVVTAVTGCAVASTQQQQQHEGEEEVDNVVHESDGVDGTTKEARPHHHHHRHPPHDRRVRLFHAGQPVELQCIALHYGDATPSSAGTPGGGGRYDVALKVRPEKLAPDWLYAGHAVRPLGLLEPGGTLAFTVTLLPWRAGWLRVDSGLELVDARAPEKVLWPTPATWLEVPAMGTVMTTGKAGVVSSTSSAAAAVTASSSVSMGGGTVIRSGTTAAAAAGTSPSSLTTADLTLEKEAFPPVLCEVFVV